MFANLNQLMYAAEWLIDGARYDALLALYLRATAPDGAEHLKQAVTADMFSRPPLSASGIDDQAIGHYVADGVLSPRLSQIEQKCGGVDTLQAVNQVQKMISSGAKGMMFHIDSPGGTGQMLPELANYISNISIPTASYTHGMEASAALWAFSGVQLKGATPSATIGSIGGFIPFIDRSQQLEQMGIKWAPVVSDGATLKTALMGPSLSEEERVHLKEGLNATVRKFKQHLNVTRFRAGKTLDWSILDKGGAYRADEAARLGLVDVVGSYNDVYDTLVSRARRA